MLLISFTVKEAEFYRSEVILPKESQRVRKWGRDLSPNV